MAALSAFVTAYLNPASPVLPVGARQQLAGAVKAVELQFSQGAAGATAVANVNNRRNRRIVYKAQRDASTSSPALVSDFYAIDSL